MSINVKEKFNVDLSRWSSVFTSATATQVKGALEISASPNGNLFSNFYNFSQFNNVLNSTTVREEGTCRLLFIAKSKIVTPSIIGISLYGNQLLNGEASEILFAGLELFQDDSLNILHQEASANGQVNASLTPIFNYDIGDLIEIILDFRKKVYTTSARNLTKKSQTFSITNTVVMGSLGTTERLSSYYGIAVPNGIFDILSFNVGNINEPATIMFVGDSISEGYDAGNYSDSFVGILEQHTSQMIVNESQASTCTFDFTGENLSEVLSYNNVKYVLVNVGGNDVLSSRTQPQSLADYDSFIASLKAAKKTVIHLLSTPRTAFWGGDWVVTRNTHIQNTYPNDIIIDTYTPLKDPSSPYINPIYSTEGLHPNTAAHAILANVIKTNLPYLFNL